MKYLIVLFILIPCCLQSVAQSADSAKRERISFHAQTTIIDQYKPPFKAPYTGENSLIPGEENHISLTSTLYFGARLWKGAELYVNPELAGGSGLSKVLGLGDATNGETFRIGSVEPKAYMARLFLRQVIALDGEKEYTPADLNQLAGYNPTRYLAFTVGKISLADYFDDNSYSHDPRTQFMNWGLMDNGAWDFAANTRGYAPGFVAEYVTPENELRYCMALLPQEANGLDMNWNIGKSQGHNLEFTHRYHMGPHKGAIRLLGFLNTTKMGNYHEAIGQKPIDPDITETRMYGRTKYGFGLNMEQEISRDLGFFMRAGWNDGNNEIWAFTQIDHTLSMGLSLDGEKWKREDDHIGLAYVVSGLSTPHQHYLSVGGKDFMLGDGRLNYKNEMGTEVYYSAQCVKDHIYLTGAYQFLMNPGYNKDRHGPVNVFSVRLHTVI